MRPITFLVAVLAVVPFNAVTAQDSLPVKPGDRVRVTHNCVARARGSLRCRKDTGSFHGVSRDTLALLGGFGTPINSITKLEVSRGRKSNAVKGALLGGIPTGLIIGGLVAALCASPDIGCSNGLGLVAAGFGVGFVGGAFIGGVIGALSTTDRWEEVPLDQLRVSFVPQRDGRFRLGLSVGF